MFFLKLWLVSFTLKVQIIHENAIIFFLFKNAYFTQSPSCSSNIHNIVIAINTPTTMNNQFEALIMHLKIDFNYFFLNSYEVKTISLYFLSIFIQKITKILILNFLWFIEPLKVTILGGLLSFELLCAWRRLMCAKKVISLI